MPEYGLNRVELIGRVYKEPILRTAGSVHVLKFVLLTREPGYQQKGHGRSDDVIAYHRIAIFGAHGEAVYKWLCKGMLVYIDGRIHTSMWRGKNEWMNYSYEVTANTIRLLGQARAQQEVVTEGEGEGAAVDPSPTPLPPPLPPQEEERDVSEKDTADKSQKLRRRRRRRKEKEPAPADSGASRASSEAAPSEALKAPSKVVDIGKLKKPKPSEEKLPKIEFPIPPPHVRLPPRKKKPEGTE